MEQKQISRAVIQRLPRYYRYLGELLLEGVDRISSQDLSRRMGVTASQIRQDLNNYGGFGQQGYGYNVKHLHDELGKILGQEKTYNMIIVGAGNLGQALANYVNFERRGYLMIGIFDHEPALEGKLVRDIPVRLTSDLPDFLQKEKVDIEALTLPKSGALEVCPILVENGVRAIWNFAHTDLDVPSNVVVENVHLSDSLMQLSYRLNQLDQIQ